MNDGIGMEDFFRMAHGDPLCNTSYPIGREHFAPWRSDADIMADSRELCLYIHIPFCRSLCSFCEYTRFLIGDGADEARYLDMLERQAETWLGTHDIALLRGFDIGGGTPTALGERGFRRLADLAAGIMARSPLSGDFEPSMEFSCATLTDDKIAMMGECGFRRASTGIQTHDRGLLSRNRREIAEIDALLSAGDRLRAHGVRKLNLDVMYGIPGQTEEMLRRTLDALRIVRPEQVTLYEMRHNRTGTAHADAGRDALFGMYRILHDGLREMDYAGRFGRNAFSMDAADEGVSSYLRARMNEAVHYKGLGVSAQSMSWRGISYNTGKGSRSATLPDIGEITEEDSYLLPPDEIAAKYVCIALYSGRFSIGVVEAILGADIRQAFGPELDFLLDRGLAAPEDGFCVLTPEGFRHYGAVAALFWSERHRERWLRMRGRPIPAQRP